eukprot:8056775-Prorocentrum_lima.AAC.1
MAPFVGRAGWGHMWIPCRQTMRGMVAKLKLPATLPWEEERWRTGTAWPGTCGSLHLPLLGASMYAAGANL